MYLTDNLHYGSVITITSTIKKPKVHKQVDTFRYCPFQPDMVMYTGSVLGDKYKYNRTVDRAELLSHDQFDIYANSLVEAKVSIFEPEIVNPLYRPDQFVEITETVLENATKIVFPLEWGNLVAYNKQEDDEWDIGFFLKSGPYMCRKGAAGTLVNEIAVGCIGLPDYRVRSKIKLSGARVNSLGAEGCLLTVDGNYVDVDYSFYIDGSEMHICEFI